MAIAAVELRVVTLQTVKGEILRILASPASVIAAGGRDSSIGVDAMLLEDMIATACGRGGEVSGVAAILAEGWAL